MRVDRGVGEAERGGGQGGSQRRRAAEERLGPSHCLNILRLLIQEQSH